MNNQHSRYKSAINGLLLCFCSISCLPSAATAAESEVERINDVKAAFVLNIARFVTWPTEVFEGRNDHLLLCIYRTNPFGKGLDSIRGRTVAGRQLKISEIQNLKEGQACQILLVSTQELKQFSVEANTGVTRALLTIADKTAKTDESDVNEGVLVSLVRVGVRMGFEIDLERSRNAGLKMSSELLKHARIVGKGP